MMLVMVTAVMVAAMRVMMLVMVATVMAMVLGMVGVMGAGMFRRIAVRLRMVVAVSA